MVKGERCLVTDACQIVKPLCAFELSGRKWVGRPGVLILWVLTGSEYMYAFLLHFWEQL